VRRMLVAGNWKMNATGEFTRDLASAIAADWSSGQGGVDVLVCPPFPYLSAAYEALGDSAVLLGAQDAYFESPGAFTGEIAPEMLLDVGCQYVIIGHSERRHVLGETNDIICQKVMNSLAKGLKVILCVGELLQEREEGRTQSVLADQMQGALAPLEVHATANLVIAYEPVWAIGTGKTATAKQADSAQEYLRNWLGSRYNPEVAAGTGILYGGSVKPANALELLSQPNVDGALVGGASLEAESFLPIVHSAVKIANS